MSFINVHGLHGEEPQFQETVNEVDEVSDVGEPGEAFPPSTSPQIHVSHFEVPLECSSINCSAISELTPVCTFKKKFFFKFFSNRIL